MGAKHQLKGIYFPKKAGLRRRVESVGRNGVGEDALESFHSSLLWVYGKGGETPKRGTRTPPFTLGKEIDYLFEPLNSSMPVTKLRL